MNKQTQQFLENEAQRLQKSIRMMEDTFEKREAQGVDDKQLAGMREIYNNEQVQLEYMQFLQERAETLDDVLNICRIYLNLANDIHADIQRPDNTQAWHETLNDKHYLTALIDRVHLELDNFTPPESDNQASFSPDDGVAPRQQKPSL
ncbi:MAG: hypothetical protein AAFV93_20260 [Chloroflexota bacterium]